MLKTYQGHTIYVRSLILFNEPTIVSGSDDKTIKIFNAVDGTCLKSFISQNNRPVICLLKLNDYQLCSANTDIIAILNTF